MKKKIFSRIKKRIKIKCRHGTDTRSGSIGIAYAGNENIIGTQVSAPVDFKRDYGQKPEYYG